MGKKLSSKDAEKLRRRLEAERKRMKWNHRPPNVEFDPIQLEDYDEQDQLGTEDQSQYLHVLPELE